MTYQRRQIYPLSYREWGSLAEWRCCAIIHEIIPTIILRSMPRMLAWKFPDREQVVPLGDAATQRHLVGCWTGAGLVLKDYVAVRAANVNFRRGGPPTQAIKVRQWEAQLSPRQIMKWWNTDSSEVSSWYVKAGSPLLVRFKLSCLLDSVKWQQETTALRGWSSVLSHNIRNHT